MSKTAPKVEVLATVQDGASKLLHHADTFTAFQTLLHSDCGEDKILSGDAREGLAYMFKLLADDAINARINLLEALDVLNKGACHE